MKPTTREWVRKAENDFRAAGQLLGQRKGAVPDAICFFCQQCIEKYLKARLLEAGVAFVKTHDLRQLLTECIPVEPHWSSYAKALDVLSDYAVDFRYPGHSATLVEARRAYKQCRSVRSAARSALKLRSTP